MTRNQRLRRRLRMEQRQAKRRKLKLQQLATNGRKNEIIRMLLAQRRPETYGVNAFTRAVFAKAPRLAHYEQTVAALDAMKNVSKFRDVQDWQPQGKSSKALLVSLANHLFAKWPMPQILWSAFWDEASIPYRKAVAKVAAGDSLFALCRSGKFPVSLSKKQCYRLLKMPARFSLLEAVRLLQVEEAGGDKLLFDQWWQTPIAKRCHAPQEEVFWQQFLNWLVKQKSREGNAINGNTIDALSRFMHFMHSEDRTYNLKGRSFNRVMQQMQDWQKERQLMRSLQGQNLPGSGYIDLSWQQTVKNTQGVLVPLHWDIYEILSKADLHAEGKVMNHCVYTYKSQVQKGLSSIWTVSVAGKKCLTFELRNQLGKVIQIKGKSNREPDKLEMAAIRYWANYNGLSVAGAA